MAKDFVTVRGTIKHITHRAILFHDDATDEECWIPISQIESNQSDYSELGETELLITEWIAEQKGLI